MKDLFYIFCTVFLLSCGGEDSVPIVEIVAPLNGTVYAELDTIQFIATVTHDLDVQSLNTNIEPIFAMGALDVSQVEDPQNIEFGAEIPIFLSIGSYNFVLTATDILGNTGSDSFNFVVE